MGKRNVISGFTDRTLERNFQKNRRRGVNILKLNLTNSKVLFI